MNNYKVGDMVRLKSWEELREICVEDDEGDLEHKETGCFAVQGDIECYGREYEIQQISDDFVSLKTPVGYTSFFRFWEIEPIKEKIEIEPCVVHCPTKEVRKELLQWLSQNTGLRWCAGREIPDSIADDIPHYGIDEYLIIDERLSRCDFSYLDGRATITYEQFMKKYADDDSQKSRALDLRDMAKRVMETSSLNKKNRIYTPDGIIEIDKNPTPEGSDEGEIEGGNDTNVGTKKRTWEVTTEAKSSDGIKVADDYIIIGYEEGKCEWDGSEEEARDLMNKLRKGLEKHDKLFNKQ